jgi:hypothetical protein
MSRTKPKNYHTGEPKKIFQLINYIDPRVKRIDEKDTSKGGGKGGKRNNSEHYNTKQGYCSMIRSIPEKYLTEITIRTNDPNYNFGKLSNQSHNTILEGQKDSYPIHSKPSGYPKPVSPAIHNPKPVTPVFSSLEKSCVKNEVLSGVWECRKKKIKNSTFPNSSHTRFESRRIDKNYFTQKNNSSSPMVEKCSQNNKNKLPNKSNSRTFMSGYQFRMNKRADMNNPNNKMCINTNHKNNVAIHVGNNKFKSIRFPINRMNHINKHPHSHFIPTKRTAYVLDPPNKTCFHNTEDMTKEVQRCEARIRDIRKIYDNSIQRERNQAAKTLINMSNNISSTPTQSDHRGTMSNSDKDMTDFWIRKRNEISSSILTTKDKICLLNKNINKRDAGFLRIAHGLVKFFLGEQPVCNQVIPYFKRIIFQHNSPHLCLLSHIGNQKIA